MSRGILSGKRFAGNLFGRVSSPAVLRRSRSLKFEPLESREFLAVGGLPGAAAESTPSSVETALLADQAPGQEGSPSVAGYDRFGSAEELRQYLIEDALRRYGHLFGQPVNSYGRRVYSYRFNMLDTQVITADWNLGMFRNNEDAVAVGMLSNVTASVAGLSASSDSFDYSETNVQVEGVDEGDLIETDGNYLYVLSEGQLVIVDARQADDPRVASQVDFKGRTRGMYLHGDRLTVLSSRSSDEVTVRVFDVSDRYAPSLVQETELDGYLEDSRAIGDSVYLVLRHHKFELPPPERVPVASADGTETGEYVYETAEQYLQRLEGQVLDLALPNYRSYDADGQVVQSGALSEAPDVYRPPSDDHTSLVSVVVIDASRDTPGVASSVSVPTQGSSTVYMSAESIYLLESAGQETSILKFDLEHPEHRVNLSAVGAVDGSVLDQFSIDEFDGYLRVATTGSQWRGSVGQNNLYVLEQNGTQLDVVGRLEGLAPNEKIYSARFQGERAFLVTFRKVDPLFVIDLSDPTNPQVTGELKVTGFSNYLHAIEDGFLIGVGRDAQGGFFQDPQVSLFDVNDPIDPQLVDRYTIETGRSGGLGIFNDHHVIAYYPEYQVLTVSVAGNDLWTFRIDTSADLGGEIDFLGRIEHDSDVSRSVRIDDRLYAISQTKVTVHSLLDPASQIASLDLPTDPTPPPGTGGWGDRVIFRQPIDVSMPVRFVPREVAIPALSPPPPVATTGIDPDTAGLIAVEFALRDTADLGFNLDRLQRSPLLEVADYRYLNPAASPKTVVSAAHDAVLAEQLDTDVDSPTTSPGEIAWPHDFESLLDGDPAAELVVATRAMATQAPLGDLL